MNSFRPLVIEDWNSDDDSEVEFISNVENKFVRPSTKKIKFDKSARETPKQNKHYPRGNRRNWNNLMSQRLGRDFKMINKACFVVVVLEPRHNSVNTAVKPVNTAGSKLTMNHPRPITNAFKNGYSQVTRPFNKHMTRNKCYLTEYEDYGGGFVSFGDGKGRIFGKVLLWATIDESNLWHRRLGHINFKNMNKLVRGNLVRGLPSKIFENDHSCVACQKGKQHKASCKTKLVNSISKPLHMLHMDLFGPTNDETSGILKTFITEIENQLDYKVKVIRSDNGTEFKNSVMNQFCEMKGIKREFSVARTPQQNGVAERRNRTLIEAARTMLVLVIKPHNKTPYELIRGRTSLIDFMKPFGCPVTILNTRDHLGKFDGKADEGFFVGYSVVSKAMRVFNKRTKIVEETLNIRFLENTPNVTGNGPDWLFDVDSLTISMNYVPVVAGNQTNGIAGTRDNIITGPKDSEEDSGMKPTEMVISGALDKDGKDDQATRSEFEVYFNKKAELYILN
ncbi:putative ribonuclease H-like domain-containing protein [Tanacetum coccineum]